MGWCNLKCQSLCQQLKIDTFLFTYIRTIWTQKQVTSAQDYGISWHVCWFDLKMLEKERSISQFLWGRRNGEAAVSHCYIFSLEMRAWMRTLQLHHWKHPRTLVHQFSSWWPWWRDLQIMKSLFETLAASASFPCCCGLLLIWPTAD